MQNPLTILIHYCPTPGMMKMRRFYYKRAKDHRFYRSSERKKSQSLTEITKVRIKYIGQSFVKLSNYPSFKNLFLFFNKTI